MSAAPNVTESEPSDEPLDFGDFGVITPILKTDNQEVEPIYTGKVEGTSSGNGTEHRDMCGNTQFEKVGDDRWRITIEGIITKSQMNTLKQMKPADQEVKVISDIHTGYVEFDRFTITQNDDLNYGTFLLNGSVITEPLFKFQLQTRDNEDQ